MVVEWCGVGEFCEGSSDGHAPLLLSSFQERNFVEPAADANQLDFNDVAFVMPANDNLRTKDRLSARCRTLLRRLIALHGLNWPF